MNETDAKSVMLAILFVILCALFLTTGYTIGQKSTACAKITTTN